MRRFLGGALLLLSSCTSLPSPVAMPQELDGDWRYVGGEPTDDALLSWNDWPDRELTIDAAQGVWRVSPTAGTRSVLPRVSRVTAVNGTVLTLVSSERARSFQIYWRIEGGRLEIWWGSHPDWTKPFLIYQRP